jgi:YggT family protein
MVVSIFNLLMLLINLFVWALLLACLMSMLLAFGILDPRNRVVYGVADFLNRLTEPVLAPVRAVLPRMGAVDFSPLVVLLGIQYLLVPALRQLFLMMVSRGV